MLVHTKWQQRKGAELTNPFFFFFFFKKSGDLLSPNKPIKFQGPRSNIYQEILLTRKAWQANWQTNGRPTQKQYIVNPSNFFEGMIS